jgi:hypothetical protein
VFEPPLTVDVVDRPAGVLGDLATAMRTEPRVVVGRVVGEVRSDPFDVAGVQRLVVAADVVERRDADLVDPAARVLGRGGLFLGRLLGLGTGVGFVVAAAAVCAGGERDGDRDGAECRSNVHLTSQYERGRPKECSAT